MSNTVGQHNVDIQIINTNKNGKIKINLFLNKLFIV